MAENTSKFSATVKSLGDTKVDFNTYLKWLRDVENNPFIESARVDYSLTELMDYVGSKLNNPDVRFWGIFTELDEFIGTIKLDTIDFKEGRAWLGVMIGDSAQRGKGYGQSVLQQIAEYSLVTLELKELFLGVHKDNLPALKLYLKQGFKIIETNDHSFVMKKNLISPTEL